MPLKGYTPLFEAMLDHPNITVRLGEDAIPHLGLDGDVLTVDGVPFQGPVVYTARRMSCSAAASAPCPTAPWTSGSRPWTRPGSRAGAQ